MKEYQSLSHTRWDCKYHVVFIPKRRKKRIFGVLRRQLGEIFHELARHKESYLVAERQAHYRFTVNGNQPHLFEEIVLHFEDPQEPAFVDNSSLEHGRIEIRKIWTTSALNGYLDLPHPRQAFAGRENKFTVGRQVATFTRPTA